MFTRCPGCQAVYELNAALLADAAGVVRCGNCGKTFNTLSQLFEHHPDQETDPLQASGMPPLLEHPDLVQTELPVDFDPFDDERESQQAATETPLAFESPPRFDGRLAAVAHHRWLIVSIVLMIALLVQSWLVWQSPRLPFGTRPDTLLEHLDPAETVQIVFRDMHPHPSLDDAVVVSFGLSNQAGGTVRFPGVEMRFFDASQQLLGVRRLAPEEYLDDDNAIESGMQPDTVVPVLLEFVVDGSMPTGFELTLY